MNNSDYQFKSDHKSNKTGYNLILASASPRRRELLTQIGMEFEVMPSGVEEETKSTVPCEMVMELSERKAKDVFESQFSPSTMWLLGIELRFCSASAFIH